MVFIAYVIFGIEQYDI